MKQESDPLFKLAIFSVFLVALSFLFKLSNIYKICFSLQSIAYYIMGIIYKKKEEREDKEEKDKDEKDKDEKDKDEKDKDEKDK